MSSHSPPPKAGLMGENLPTIPISSLFIWPDHFFVASPPDFPDGSAGEESACSAGDPGSIPALGSSPGGGNGNPLQHSWLGNPMDRGAWGATVYGVAESQM